MLLIDCPFAASVPSSSFATAGKRISRARRSRRARRQGLGPFLYGRGNPRGLHAERWRHVHGCGRFFNALRDTTTDRFTATYKIGEERPSSPEARRAAGA